jgi:hypothetical protein
MARSGGAAPGRRTDGERRGIQPERRVCGFPELLGNAYGGPIEPDENIGTDSEEHDRTAALEAAGRWIIEQATHRPSLGVGQVADGHVGRFLRERVLIPGTAHAFRRIPEVEVLVPIEGEVDPEGIEEGDQIIATGTAR